MADVVLVHIFGGMNEYPPLGLGYLASIALADGRSAKIIDPQTDPAFSIEKFKKTLLKENPDFVGFCLYTPYVLESFGLIRAAREVLPDAIIIAGGPHASATLEITMKECPEIDLLMFGEGEETFREILLEKPLETVRGLLYRRGKKLVKNMARPYIADLDAIPFPARHLFSKNYVYDVCVQNTPVANIATSRGCPYNCIFCCKETFGSAYRKRSVGNVVAEILEARDKYGFKELCFQEDLFTLDRKWVVDFCSALAREKIGLPWKCYGRADSLDEKMMRAMKKAGCHTVYLGIESGNDGVLKAIGKNITTRQIRDCVASAKKAELDVAGFFSLGHPGDDEKTISRTIDFAKELNLDWYLFYLVPPFREQK